MPKRVDLNSEWARKAREMRARKKTWAVISRVLKKSRHQCRYVVDDNYRTQLRARYQKVGAAE